MRIKSQGGHSLGSTIKIMLIIALCVLGGCDYSPSISPGKKQHGVISPTLSPDNSTIVFAMNDEPGIFDIAFYKIDSKKITRINPTGQSCLAPIFSTDGKMVVFTSGVGDDRNIFVMNVDGSNVRQLTHTKNQKNLQKNGHSIVQLNATSSFFPNNAKVIFKDLFAFCK